MRATDLQRLLARDEVQVVPLRRGEVGMLSALADLGPVAWSTGSPGAVLTAWGAPGPVQVLPDGTRLLARPDGAVWVGGAWMHTVLVLGRGAVADPRLVLFSGHGERLHQVRLTAGSDLAVLQDLLERHQGCRQCLAHEARPCAAPIPFDCPGSLLRSAWREAASSGDLEARLEGLGVNRLLALRALEGLHTEPLGMEDLRRMLGCLAERRLPVYVEVGGREGGQGLRTAFDRAHLEADTWELWGQGTHLRMEVPLVDHAWIHPQPWDGRLRVDCFNARGEAVASLGCPLDAGPAVLRDWEALVG